VKLDRQFKKWKSFERGAILKGTVVNKIKRNHNTKFNKQSRLTTQANHYHKPKALQTVVNRGYSYSQSSTPHITKDDNSKLQEKCILVIDATIAKKLKLLKPIWPINIYYKHKKTIWYSPIC
jgi:predicted methyltransferase